MQSHLFLVFSLHSQVKDQHSITFFSFILGLINEYLNKLLLF